MSSSREIRSKIASIKNTQKITRAMQMVAASKMHKAQNRMNATRPYTEKILSVITNLAGAHPEYKNLFMEVRDIKRIGYIVVTTDKGLCGPLNLNVLKETIIELKNWASKGVEQDLCLIGNKADSYFKHFGKNIVSKTSLGDDKTGLKNLIGTVKLIFEEYANKKIDALYISYNKFVNTMSQRALIQQLLPIEPGNKEQGHYWDYIYEPDAKYLLDKLLRRYVEMQVYQGVVENIACEQAARMLAMKNATDNATDVIADLQLAYNKARQAMITREIAEIVGGAAAIGSR